LNNAKKKVHDYWQNASCGETLYLKGRSKDDYLEHSQIRYKLEPYIIDFAGFGRYKDKKVLEIGVGLGADHQKFAEAGADLHGIDLTERAIEHTSRRLKVLGLQSDLRVNDAENVPFPDNYFDLVYSWGVIHYTPDVPSVVNEIHRILKPGGEAKVMVYHKHSFVGYMLWIRYALLTGRPWMSLKRIYDRYLESPGTKAYSYPDAKKLFHQFKDLSISTVLTHGDLLTSAAGQSHEGTALSIARAVWPRYIIKKLFPAQGLFMMIKAVK
jgi:ubiquinone/menaquinone biosynthesis C-methylase UbiE